MRDETAFDGTAFLGLAREAKRDPYRLSLFAKHLEEDERPLAFLPIHGGTLLVTDRRLLQLRAHLEAHGARNVKQFMGYEVERDIPRVDVRGVDRVVTSPPEPRPRTREVEDRLFFMTKDGVTEVLVARGPQPVLRDEDLAELRTAILGPQA